MTETAPLVPEPADTRLAASALRGVNAALDAQGPVSVRLGGQSTEIVVPRSAVAALAQVLDSFARGESVTVLPTRRELTTQQAADALNVSRPFLIDPLDAGQIAYRRAGNRRRVDAASLIQYREKDDARRRSAADALTSEARALGLS